MQPLCGKSSPARQRPPRSSICFAAWLLNSFEYASGIAENYALNAVTERLTVPLTLSRLIVVPCLQQVRYAGRQSQPLLR